MKKEIAERWVAALRSGKYKQTTGKLVRAEDGEKSYCCLGVLCELAATAGIVVSTSVGFFSETDGPGRCEVFNLPHAVREWSGANSSPGQFVPEPEDADLRLPRPGATTSSLVFLNDEAHFNFEQIADVIEKYQEGL